MDVKQASKKWGCSPSTVRQYCNSGIIPAAEKLGRKWEIPDQCEKPPMTPYGLCYLIDTIFQLQDNAITFQAIAWGYSDEVVKAGYAYLVSHLFLTAFDVNQLAKELTKAKLTPRGKRLIDKEIKKEGSATKFSAYLKAKAKFGLLDLDLGGEYSK